LKSLFLSIFDKIEKGVAANYPFFKYFFNLLRAPRSIYRVPFFKLEQGKGKTIA